jgi:hypothetical protein
MALLPLPVEPTTGAEAIPDAAAIADVLVDLAATRDRELHEDPDRLDLWAAPGAEPGAGAPGRLVHLAHLPARAARYAELARPLLPAVADAVP